jgi:hypothetical protein
MTQVDLVYAPDQTPQTGPGPRRQASDRLLQEPTRPGPAASGLAARIRRRTVHAAALRKLLPAAQLTGHRTGLQRPVLNGDDRGNHTRAQPGHVMNSALVAPADRLFAPDHTGGSTPHGPFGQTSSPDYRRHDPGPSIPSRIANSITGCGCSTRQYQRRRRRLKSITTPRMGEHLSADIHLTTGRPAHAAYHALSCCGGCSW